jgi:hypothetical protein
MGVGLKCLTIIGSIIFLVISHNHQKMKVQDLSKLNLRPSPGFSKIRFESNVVENSRKLFYDNLFQRQKNLPGLFCGSL